jgi:organic hydroperoxide reductase OsmC/OhrA
MSEHKATLQWKRQSTDFVYETYDRGHKVGFPGGQNLQNSAAPAFFGKAELTNPEELLAASLGTCHMLTFLAVACKSRFVVDSYEDEAVAVLEKNEAGKMAVTKIYLRPKVRFSGTAPDAAKLQELHNKAHHNCMIGNSLKTQVIVEAQNP